MIRLRGRPTACSVRMKSLESTSIVLLRAWNMTWAMLLIERATTGRISPTNQLLGESVIGV